MVASSFTGTLSSGKERRERGGDSPMWSAAAARSLERPYSAPCAYGGYDEKLNSAKCCVSRHRSVRRSRSLVWSEKVPR